MKLQLKYVLSIGVIIIAYSCSTQKYIHDYSSFNRQKELKKTRSGHVFGDILIGSASIVSSAFIGSVVEWEPTGQQFKKLNLVNPTNDTVYVNMLTDVFWDENDYCDFMDIRIPPKENCRILVPVNTDYNVYFSKTIQQDDDELLQINTGEFKQITLKPGITLVSGSNEFSK